jgi:hypothetical protein
VGSDDSEGGLEDDNTEDESPSDDIDSGDDTDPKE